MKRDPDLGLLLVADDHGFSVFSKPSTLCGDE
jgi:hypothetical protein